MTNLETAQSLPLDGFTGEVLMPGVAGFDEARAVWNAMIDRRPAIITRCRNADDVIAAVNHACTRASFGANDQRLVEVKTKYDPDNWFRFNQNVQPET